MIALVIALGLLWLATSALAYMALRDTRHMLVYERGRNEALLNRLDARSLSEYVGVQQMMQPVQQGPDVRDYSYLYDDTGLISEPIVRE